MYAYVVILDNVMASLPPQSYRLSSPCHCSSEKEVEGDISGFQVIDCHTFPQPPVSLASRKSNECGIDSARPLSHMGISTLNPNNASFVPCSVSNTQHVQMV